MQERHDAIRLRKTCRGMWKIYALVEVPPALEDKRLVVRSTLEDGTEVPSCLLPKGPGERVLVLAVLDVTQTVCIHVIESDGTSREVLRRAFHPKVARLSSQVHTFLHDDAMEHVRNYDATPLFGQYGISITRIIQRNDGVDILQGEAVCSTTFEQGLRTPVDVLAIDRSGAVVSLDETIVMRDSVQRVPQADDVFQRSIQFSLRMPSAVETVTLWVRPHAQCEGVFAGILPIEASDLSWWREQWNMNTMPAGSNPYYTLGFDKYWGVSKSELAIQRHTKLGVDPLFSVIVPLYKTPLEYFDEMVASVLDQSYQNLELVLVNASPEDVALSQAVEAAHIADSRVKVVNLAENLGITENTNAGIRAATGDFLCFLDHDDILSLQALFCYAKALEEYPDTDMFYSDEDHLENGEHKHVYFKPDWEPDLLMGMNYVCHFLAVRKSIVDELEPPTSEYDGAQDHHMAFRVSEKARNIYHCRKVLYHWRIHPQSTASGVDAKPYAIEAGRRAIQSHLDRCGEGGTVAESRRIPTRFEVEYENPDEPMVSIIIPNKDAVPVLDRCIRSIVDRTEYQNYEILVIENNSVDEDTFAYYKRLESEELPLRVVHYEGTFNYAKINNFGAAHAQGEYYLLLNNDTEVITGDWLGRMVSVCRRDSTGIVGAKLLYPDDTVQHAGVFAIPGGPDHANRGVPADIPWETVQLMQDVSAVTGACLMISKDVFTEVGGMDEAFEVDYNDVDLCWKVRAAGYLVVYNPSVVLYHYESVSRGFHSSKESKLRFEREKALLRGKWPKRLAYSDPMSNPNFDQYSNFYKLP